MASLNIVRLLFNSDKVVAWNEFAKFAAKRQLYLNSVQSAVICEGCTSMAENFFDGFVAMKMVTFLKGANVKFIGNNAFRGCKLLNAITIPATVEEIGSGCFQKCSSLCYIEFESGSQLCRIGANAFSDCVKLEKIEIPAGVEVMGQGIFSGCSNLSKVTFAEGSHLRKIEARLLAETSVEAVTLPSTVEEICGHIFGSNSGSITLDGNKFAIVDGFLMTSDRTQIISATSELTSTVTIPASVEVISDYAFAGKEITDLVFEGNSQLKSIGAYAFAYCGIKTMLLETCQCLKTIGESAFAEHSIETLVIPKSVEHIGDYWLSSDDSYDMNVVFEEGSQLKVITGNMFGECQMASIKLVSGLEEIEEEAFHSSFIEDLVLPEGLKTIGMHVLGNGISIRSITFPDSLKEIPDAGIVDWEKHNYLAHVNWGHGITRIPGGAYGTGMCYESSIDEIFIPNTVEVIEAEAFAGVSDGIDDDTTLTFEENSRLRVIEKSAFGGRAFKTAIIIPKSVEVLGEKCFGDYDDCLSQDGGSVEIQFEEGSQLKTIGAGAFSGKSIDNFEIPPLVENLDGAFDGCVVDEMTLHPDNKNFYIDNEKHAILTADKTRVVTTYCTSNDV